jgi:hypothetical protein
MAACALNISRFVSCSSALATALIRRRAVERRTNEQVGRGQVRALIRRGIKTQRRHAGGIAPRGGNGCERRGNLVLRGNRGFKGHRLAEN